MSNLSTLPKGDSAWLLRKAIERIIQQVSVLETNIGASTSGNSANTQIIFNDNGTLRGDAGLVYNKTTDALTVAGLVTAGSATITGAATVGTTLGVTGKSTLTGNVAIGTTSSPWLAGLSALDISSNGLCAYSGGITHNAYYDNTDSRWEYKGTGGAAFYNPQNGTHEWFVAASGTANAAITTFATAAMTLNSTGNLAFPTGKGIDFSAVTGGTGTATANVLNDYEEGTWDASFVSGGGTVTINTALNRCRYTKIGRLVTVNGLIQVSSVSSPTGPLLISGLPFTIPAATEGDTYSAVSVFPVDLEITATGQIVGYGLPGSTNIYLYRYQAGAVIGLAPSAKAASEFTFTLTYSV